MFKDNGILYKEIQLPFKIKRPVLAVGAETKNTLCYAEGVWAHLGPVHPDLSSPDDLFSFERELKRLLKKKPKVIAYDLHPEYQSTKSALGLEAKRYKLFSVQHHHAHIASCMAENGLHNKKVIGVAFDGTGLGTDSTLWGAEFLVCDYKSFIRRAHLKEVALLGGEMAIREPWRLAAAWLFDLYKNKFPKVTAGFSKCIKEKDWQVLKEMCLKKFNAPLSSSMGRLFDAAASLILAKCRAGYEAELAIELERLATAGRARKTGYGFKISKAKDGYILDPSLLFKGIVSDLKIGEAKEDIAYRFHLTVAEMIRKTCVILRKEDKINSVVLSGGVFQNKILLRLTLDMLHRENFKVFIHKELSCNDSCLSLGQAVIAGY